MTEGPLNVIVLLTVALSLLFSKLLISVSKLIVNNVGVGIVYPDYTGNINEIVC